MTYTEWISDENLIRLEAWARDGLTEADICKNIGIATVTLWDWKKKYPNISNALKKGKEVADIIIENALYKKATGYNVSLAKTFKVKEVIYNENGKKIKETEKLVVGYDEMHIPADTTAQIYWLNNRKPEVWRNRKEIEIGTETTQQLTSICENMKKIREEV